jgi:hypothetical protein
MILQKKKKERKNAMKSHNYGYGILTSPFPNWQLYVLCKTWAKRVEKMLEF